MSEQQWTTEISRQRTWFALDLRELWRYRDLIMLFVRRDFVAVYKQTILGPFWCLLQPIFSTLVFTIVFGIILGVSTEDVPQSLFFFSGIVVWNYFASCLNRTSDVLVGNKGIFGKVYFPRLAVPISTVIVNLITFFIQFLLFLVVLWFFSARGAAIQITPLVTMLPLLILQMSALGLGIGIFISSLTTKYRDLSFLIGFAVQLWMYATPIVYPLSQVPQNWRWIFDLNPMTFVVETFRQSFWGGGVIDLSAMAISLGETGLLLFAAICVYSRVEKTFMDTV